MTVTAEYVYGTKPLDHQKQVFEETCNKEYYGIFWEMGLGKTKLIIDTACYLWLTDQIEQVLIIAPKGMYRQWKEEFHKHAPKKGINLHVFIWCSVLRKKDKEDYVKVFEHDELTLPVLVINTEALSASKAFKEAKVYLKDARTLICLDESSMIKTPKANRTKNAVALARLCDFRRILSGTPITQSPLDIFSQAEFLQSNLLGFKNFFHFKHYYAIQQAVVMGTRRFNKVVGYNHIEELREDIQTFSSRLLKEDCLDLPPKVFVKQEVDLHPEQRDLYERFKAEALVRFDQGLLTSTSALTTLIKLHQILCGHVKLDNGTIESVPNYRIDALLEVLSLTTGKVLIWCAYQEDVRSIKRALDKAEIGSVMYYGETSDSERRGALNLFNETSACRCFIATPQTGGKGLNLISANTEIFYSNNYSLEIRLQAEDRAHRYGQTKTVTIIDLCVPRSLDERIIKSLHAKQDLAASIIETFKEIV